MATLSNQEFWKEKFDTGGNHPFSWFDVAFGLLTSAEVLDRFKGNVYEDLRREPKVTRLQYERMSVGRVNAMLRAMAVECLLKALWLQGGGKLALDGRYIGAMKKSEHRLHDLARAVSQKGQIAFTQRELDLLELASSWIVTGRYPIQKEYSYLVPFDRPDGTVAPKQYWRGDPFKELRVLTERLLTTLGIEMKFEK